MSIIPHILLQELFRKALAAVDPAVFMPEVLSSLPRGPVVVIGAGKGSGAMARAIEEHWNDPITGLVIVRDGYARPTHSIEVCEASHPIPDVRGVAATKRLLETIDKTDKETQIIGLWSGGASSLLVQPAKGLTLPQKQSISRTLLQSGARIQEINTVRKHLSSVKGGRLAVSVGQRHLLNLFVSDVVGDDPAVIGSGPTVADPTTCADALRIINRYEIAIPKIIRDGLRSGALETPKHLPENIINHVVASPKNAILAARQHCLFAGVEVVDLGDKIEGEACEVAKELVQSALGLADQVQKPVVFLSGGEVTVTMNRAAAGGPNLEFCLAMALALEGHPRIWGLSCDTDGTDGASASAGAIVTPDTLSRATLIGRDAIADLTEHRSEDFFHAIGDLVTPGPTGTNVNDFRALLVLPK
ncbi:MAG: glycerate kinase [Rhodospirillaceae bacterium]